MGKKKKDESVVATSEQEQHEAPPASEPPNYCDQQEAATSGDGQEAIPPDQQATADGESEAPVESIETLKRNLAERLAAENSAEIVYLQRREERYAAEDRLVRFVAARRRDLRGVQIEIDGRSYKPRYLREEKVYRLSEVASGEVL